MQAPPSADLTPTPSSLFTIRITTPRPSSQLCLSNASQPPASEEEEELSSVSREQFLQLEIRQLKRENAFLKKKLTQLTAHSGDGRRRDRTRSKRSSHRKGHAVKPEPLPLTIELFFKEVHNMLATIVQLFRMEVPEDLASPAQDPPTHKSLSKLGLARKLQRILLCPQEQAFPLLLQSFTDYYQTKEQREQQLIQSIDRMTEHTHALNASLLRQAQLRSSCQETASTLPEQSFETLRLSPRNIVANTRLATYSPRERPTPFAQTPHSA